MKTLKLSAELAAQMLGKNETFDLLIKENFTTEELNPDITERVKSFNDILSLNGLTLSEFKSKYDYLEPHKFALEQLELIAKTLNGGVLKRDGKTNLYYPYFITNESSFAFDDCTYVNVYTRVSSRLCFKNSDLAIFAGKTFIDIYRVYLNG